ncbi:MAG: hypothetical protein ACO1SX_00425, partial [Actinomycetota bacterium]
GFRDHAVPLQNTPELRSFRNHFTVSLRHEQALCRPTIYGKGDHDSVERFVLLTVLVMGTRQAKFCE